MIPTSKYMAGPFLARRRTRRWIVGLYWGALVPLTAFVVARVFARRPIDGFTLLIAAVMVFNLWSMSRVGIKRSKFFRPDPDMMRFRKGPEETRSILQDFEFDERETQERDAIHFRAYHWIAGAAFAAFAALALGVYLRPEWARWLGPTILSLLIATIGATPQTLVLWNEPDVDQAETSK